MTSFPSPPGTYINLDKKDLDGVFSYRQNQPIVGTYFFYWYNIYTKEHFINHDGTDALVDHPVSEEDFSYTSVNWWMREMRDVVLAGIDFIAPVYWGVPGYDSWSFQGVTRMVEAWDKLISEGKNAPRIGLFYDTSTLRHNPPHKHIDLTTQEGKEWLYNTIRDYFSLVPPRMWATLEGRPIILLYSAAFAAKQDPAALDFVYKSFEKDFACLPYIVKEVSWQGNADATYAWGGALGPQWHDVLALGPGYDHHAVPGRKPLVVDREDGKFYQRAWESLLAQNPKRRPSIVMVETWNELHEGTDICETREYGRQYIEMTAQYAAQFKSGTQIPQIGSYNNAKEVSWDSIEGEKGAKLLNSGDGLIESIKEGDIPAVRSVSNPHGGRYIYVALDDSFIYDQDMTVSIQVTYLDKSCESFRLEYDSSDPLGSVRQGAFKFGGEQTIEKSGQWKTATFTVKDGRFVNRCNGGDFRFPIIGGDLTIRRVVVKR